MITFQKLEAFTGEDTASECREFATRLGSVMYAMVTTRLDIAYACSSMAQFTQNPRP